MSEVRRDDGGLVGGAASGGAASGGAASGGAASGGGDPARRAVTR
ncbi:hypothetical protein AB0B68_12210 [Micromonospora sp. NPDC049049]